MRTLKLNKKTIIEAKKTLKSGGVIIFPTETVYGIGCLAAKNNAIKRLYKIKKRPCKKPLQILIGSFEDVILFAEKIPKKAVNFMNKNWPGPFTLVFKKNKGVSSLITASGDTVGLRMPDCDYLLKLIREVGPIAASSANLSFNPPPTSAKEVTIKADLLIDGNQCKFGKASTVIDFSSKTQKFLRK